MFDLLLRQAKLMNGRIVDIGIENGRITAVLPHLEAEAKKTLELNQNLTLPAFVNGQLHACKSYWRRLLKTLPDNLQSLPRFEAASHVKEKYTAENVFNRVDEVMQLAIQNGTCAIRLFGDVDEASGVRAIEGLLAIREKYALWMTVQIVAFPQDGVLNEATQSLLAQSLEMGADLVGGIPWIEPTAEAQQAHTQMCFDLAQQFDRDLHFVCDDVADPNSRSLEAVAQLTLDASWHGRVSATQCSALSFYDDDYAKQVIQIVKEAGLTIFSNSHVNLIATDFDESQHPWPRSVTRIHELLQADVPVATGQDDIDNWFYPFGRNDMLEVAQFMAHNGRFAWHDSVNTVLPMVTTTPAATLSLDSYGIEIGAEANLVTLVAPDWHQAIQLQPEKQFVILKGKLAAETKRKTVVYI